MAGDEQTLTQRMFTAANIIDGVRAEFAKRTGLFSPDQAPQEWSAYDLRTQADKWDREDAAAASEAAAIEELAKDLYGLGFERDNWDKQARKEYWRAMARELYDRGYRLGGGV